MDPVGVGKYTYQSHGSVMGMETPPSSAVVFD